MAKKIKIEPPQWKRFFYSGIPVASRYEYLRINLPEVAVLNRYYDWQDGDFPAEDDIVQWLLMLEYLHFTTSGNRFFQKLCMKLPPYVKKTLKSYILRRLYPDFILKETALNEDIVYYLPVNGNIVKFGGLLFHRKDVPFMTDSSCNWPRPLPSGDFPVDATKAIGRSVYLPRDYFYRKSLRAARSGEGGPTIIVRNKLIEERRRFEERVSSLKPEKTSATIREEIYNYNKDIEPTLVENTNILQAAARAEKKSPSVVPSEPLPGHDESVFMVSGMTQGILGKGGMGMVYKILIKDLEVFHALKILRPADLIIDPSEWHQFCRRFLREAKILSNLHHTHIAQIHGFGEWKNYPYIEMEYVDGADIKNILSSGTPIIPAAATGIAIQIARALSHAHNKRYILDGKVRQGLIHRDIKPQNIMISGEGESKLLDFGVAIPAGSVTGTISSSSFVGTLQYASPEQIAGDEIDIRTDIHSFGQVLYEMVTARPPFTASNVQQLIAEKLNNSYPDPADMPVKIPKTLRYIIKTCLQRDPNRRFSSAEDLLTVLEEAHRELTKEIPDAVVRDYAENGFTITQNGIFTVRKKGWLKRLLRR